MKFRLQELLTNSENPFSKFLNLLILDFGSIQKKKKTKKLGNCCFKLPVLNKITVLNDFSNVKHAF